MAGAVSEEARGSARGSGCVSSGMRERVVAAEEESEGDSGDYF